MGFDPFSAISPARVNVVLVPAGRIQPEQFEQLVSRLLKYRIVSLGDIVANEQIAKLSKIFSPTGFPAGHVLLDYSTSIDSQWIDSFPFELNRTPQVVIALSDENSASPFISNEEEKTLQSDGEVTTPFDRLLRYFRNSVDQDQRPLVHCLAVFDSASIESPNKPLTWCSVTGEPQHGDIAQFVLSITASVLNGFDDLARDYKDVKIQSPHLIAQRRAHSHGHDVKNAYPQSSRLPAGSSQTPVIENAVEDTKTDPNSSENSRSASQSRFGFASPKNAASTESLLDNSRARYQILLGTLYLQGGRWPDALRELSEGAVATRGHVTDTIWHAHALESLMVCMVMFAWAGLDFNIPQICYSSVEKSQSGTWASLTSQMNGNTSGESSVASPQSLAKLAPGLHDAILALHTTISGATQEQLPLMMVAELRIRLADLLSVIYLRGGTLDKSAFDHLVIGAALQTTSPAQLGPPAVILRRNMIASLLSDAAEGLPSNFPSKSTIDVLVAVTSRLSILGLDRKHAIYLKLLLQKLIPGLVDARKIGAAELGIHPAAALSLQGSAANGASSSVRLGVRSILQSACEAYGLPVVLASTDQAPFESPRLSAIKKIILKWSEMHASGEFLMKLEILRICASVCEALPDLDSGLQYSTQLLALAKRSITVSSSSRKEIPHISQDEQSKVLNNIKRIVAAANKLGMPTLRARYWDEFLVRGIDLLDSHSSEKLVPHTPQELSLIPGAGKSATKDPFIYNPLAKSQKTERDAVLVTDEPAYFSVTLQNPFEFDVEIDGISILTEGCEFEPWSHNIVLGHCCSQRFILSGIPRGEGTLRITGCRARIRDCYEQDFLILPRAFLPPFALKQARAAPRPSISAIRSSVPNGESQKDTVPTADSSADFIAKTLAINVIRAQPSLSVEYTSLNLSSLMLLEGETRRITVALKNNSDKISADLLLFTFDDSVARQVQEALVNKSLSPLELYELQLQLLENPALKWIPDGDVDERPSIQPGQSRPFTFEIVGKPGLMDGTIQVDYANLGRPRSELKEKFYTRQILLPIAITVNGSVEIPRCNILPFFDRTSQKQLATDDGERNEVKTIDANGLCLVLLDFRNVWPYPITMSLQTSADTTSYGVGDVTWSGNRGALETLQPGHVSRSILIVPRVHVADSHAPIPSIGAQRQFVVSASKVSIEAEAASREAFWYREELLKSIKAVWKEQESERHGVIDVRRGIRLSARMIEALKADPVDIRFFTPKGHQPVGIDSNDESIQVSETCPLVLPVGTFSNIVVRVHNRSQRKLHLLLRLQPALRDQPHTLALDLSKRFAWSGMLQRSLHPALEPGGVHEAELGITALTSGQFEISATVEEIKASKSERRLDLATPVSVDAERMLWHAREQCVIDAV